MTQVTAKDVQRLREESGAGMMECKKALVANDGDFERAAIWLRKRGVEAAAKRSDREAGEGLIVVAGSEDGSRGAMVEVNCETDFVARGDVFRDFATALASSFLRHADGKIDRWMQAPFDDQGTIEEARVRVAATVGENVRIRRAVRMEADPSKGETMMSYVHGAEGGSAGRIGVIVRFQSDQPELGKQMAMHIAAMNPIAIRREDVPKDVIERERDILRSQAEQSGKEDALVEKMIEGRLRKWYAQSVLLEQTYIIDSEHSVGDVLTSHKSAVHDFTRFALGEKNQES